MSEQTSFGIEPTLLQGWIDHARRCGASDADAIAVAEVETQVRVRRGQTESSTLAESHEVGLRVFVGDRAAAVSSNDLRPATLRALAEHAVAAARHMDPDPDSAGPSAAELAETPAPLELWDGAVAALDAAALRALALQAEQAAFDADPRITNAEATEASAGQRAVVLLGAHGVLRQQRASSVGVVVAPIASADGAMEVDWWYGSARRWGDLPSPATIGARAAARALRRLGARTLPTCEVPVVFEAPVASRLLADLVGALSGERWARQASFLAGRLGERVAVPGLTLVDDPTIPWGVASRSFDGEGFAARPLTLIDDGVLVGVLTHLRAARKLGLPHGRNASRGPQGAPGVTATHVHLAPGEASLAQLLAQFDRCLLVTDLMGHGTDLVRGSLSQGATGLWVERGEVQFAVHEVTVAGEFGAMWQSLVGRANDLERQRGVSAPSLAFARLAVAGGG